MRRWEPQHYEYDNETTTTRYRHGEGRARSAGQGSVADYLVCLLLSGVIVAFGTGTYQLWQEAGTPTGSQGPGPKKKAFYQPFGGQEVFRFLLLGTDGKTRNGRSDTLILVGVYPRTHKVIAVSIPRDSYVSIPGHGMDKINAAYRLGGPQLTIQTVRNLFPTLPVTHYVRCDFKGFQKMVDILGGVTIDVEEPMRYTDTKQGLFIRLEQGRQTLHGYDAMCYVRFRSDGLADIGRTRRQQKFLRAALQQALQVSTIPRSLALLNALRTYADTDLTPRQIADLARVLAHVRSDDFLAATLPGKPFEKNRRSYWELVPEECTALLARLTREASAPSPVPTAPDRVIAVLNGCGRAGAARKVAQRMEQHGFQVVRTGNAESFSYERSEIRCSPARDSVARQVRRMLQCGTIVHVAPPPTDAAVVVIIGRDLQV